MVNVIVQDAAVIADLKHMDKVIEETAMKALGYLGLAFQAEAMKNASGPFNSGGPHIEWGNPGPNVRTGQLRKSIRSTMPRREGFGTYVVGVGPSIYYASWVENGNSSWPSGVKYPYMEPAFISLKPKAARIFSEAYKRLRGV
jgi:hypothetical protein